MTASEEEGETVDADDASFDAFYRSEYAAVVRLAYTLTGRQDRAEDLAEDGFLAAHDRWSKMSRYEDPAGWVRRVVTNRCVSSGRRYLTQRRLIARLSRQRPPDPTLPDPAEELWAEVRKLPRRQAQVLALVFLEDRSIDDVAQTLGCGEETVRTHLRRGRSTLADCLVPPTGHDTEKDD